MTEPLDVAATIDELWALAKQQRFRPERLRGKLSLPDAYRVQLGLLDKALAAGARQAGWKIALTSVAQRQARKADEPWFGYLLAERRIESGSTLAFGDLIGPLIECELCITIGSRLRGPGVTAEQAAGAAAAIAPAFEIVERRGEAVDDPALGVADDVSQRFFIVGAETRPYPATLDLRAVTLDVVTDGQVTKTVVARDFIDYQFQSIAWLANKLAGFGRAIEPGHQIMSGTFMPPTPIRKGQRWQARFAGVGSVGASFE